MRIYNSSGRRVISSLWNGLVNVPANIQELAALADPDALRYVGWNDSNDRLELLTFAASDIPYDPSTSGLSATDVQAAIDEVAAAGSGAVYAGYVASTGISYSVPSGWSVSKTATGTYVVTHNLGLSVTTDLSIVGTPVNSAFSVVCQLSTTGLNSFTMLLMEENETLRNVTWHFLASLNV